MAVIAKSGTPSLCSVLPGQDKTIVGLLAGEAIAAGDACYIKSDGKVWKSDGTSANAAAKVDGFACVAAAVGEAVTLAFDVNFRYGAGMTPGARIFLFTTAGTIGDAATTGGTAPIGFVVDATRIRVWQSRY
ncbi:MAG: hypothetical protein LC730_06210 [Acidobacteria bacterium]|nr:hypothetical protein [Acidobacteriota bacterium]MCA1609034.1 hypothetical protein [Acidobacteriota bacterium]